MKENLKQFANSVIVLSVLAILLGILFVVYPDISLVLFGCIVAAYLIVQGITLIVLDVRAWRMYVPFEGFLPGVLSVITGVLLAVYPSALAVYIGVLVGVWMIVSSFSGIKLAYALRFANPHWVLMVLLNVLNVIVGVFFLCTPVATSLSLTIVLGIGLIVYSASTLVTMIYFKKNMKEAEKLIAEKLGAVTTDAPAE